MGVTFFLVFLFILFIVGIILWIVSRVAEKDYLRWREGVIAQGYAPPPKKRKQGCMYAVTIVFIWALPSLIIGINLFYGIAFFIGSQLFSAQYIDTGVMIQAQGSESHASEFVLDDARYVRLEQSASDEKNAEVSWAARTGLSRGEPIANITWEKRTKENNSIDFMNDIVFGLPTYLENRPIRTNVYPLTDFPNNELLYVSGNLFCRESEYAARAAKYNEYDYYHRIALQDAYTSDLSKTRYYYDHIENAIGDLRPVGEKMELALNAEEWGKLREYDVYIISDDDVAISFENGTTILEYQDAFYLQQGFEEYSDDENGNRIATYVVTKYPENYRQQLAAALAQGTEKLE